MERETENIEMKDQLFLNLDKINDLNDQQIQQKDHRGFTLLMQAAEVGSIEAVKMLLNRGEDVDVEAAGESAVSLAFAKRHFEVVLTLLKANSKFPKNYDENLASEEIREFVKLSNILHENVSEGRDEILTVTFTKFPSLRYFYNIKNNSLLKTSILSKMFGVYELLLTFNIFLGPHENPDDLNEKLSEKEQKKLREINLKLSPDLITDSMMILLRNCKLSPDNPKHRDYMLFIRGALEFLYKIPQTSIILKIIAASHNFKIIFDFNRDSVTFLDPSAEPYMNGLFYSSGKIYIAAKDMLDPGRSVNVIAVIAHEFSHYAMFLVYGNDAKPYKFRRGARFERISKICEKLKGVDEIVDSVFEDYPDEMFHAELIVRAPQIIANYYDNQELLEQRKKVYKNLFDFYDKVVGEMEVKLPKIENKFNPFKRNARKIQRQRNLIILLVLSLIICSFGAWYFYNPNYTWNELDNDQKTVFKDSMVKFHDVDVKFENLFANDSIVYGLLSSEHIKYGLSSDFAALSKAIEESYDQHIYLNWKNMTDNMKDKFLILNVSFQGQVVNFKVIFDNFLTVAVSENLAIFEPLSLLTTLQVRNVFNNQLINISEPTETKTKFFIDRLFIDEELEVMSSYYEIMTNLQTDPEIKNFQDITEYVEENKIFLLSNFAGEGKSTTFRNFGIKLKKIFPTKWIQFVDLKNHFKAYKRGSKMDLSQRDELLKFLSEILLELKNLEKEIFSNLFKASNVIFLWDGIDEISPLYKDFIVELSAELRNSNSFQFISTRPQYSKVFKEKFRIKAHKLIPLGRNETFQFLVKYIAAESFEIDANEFWENYVRGKFWESLKFESEKDAANLNITKRDISTKLPQEVFVRTEIVENDLNDTVIQKIITAIVKGQKILLQIETSRGQLVTNPLLIRMTAEIVSDEDFIVQSGLNFYSIFDIFMDKKLNVFHQKGNAAWTDLNKVLKSSSVNVMQVHQAYALKLIFADHVEIYLGRVGWKISSLEVMKSLGKLSNDEISRFGILFVNSNDFSFTHRTFAEFLVARYFIDNFDDFQLKVTDGVKLILFNAVLFSGKFEAVRNFLRNYVKTDVELGPVFETLQGNEKLRNFTDNEEILKFFSFTDFRLSFVVPLYRLLSFQPFLWTHKEFNEFVDKWEYFEQVVGHEKFFKVLSGKDFFGNTILHKISNSFLKLLQKFLRKMKTTFSKSENKALIFDLNNSNLTAFMFAASERSFQDLKAFWEFIEDNLDMNDIKKFLRIESNSLLNALQSSTWNKDPDSFLLVAEIYGKFFEQSEIQKILSKVHDQLLPFILKTIRDASTETCIEVSQYLSNVFRNNKFGLRRFLTHRTVEGLTIFSEFENEKPDDEEKLKFFVNLLQTTFDQESFEVHPRFEMFLEHFKKIPRIFSFFNKIGEIDDENFFETFSYLHESEWFFDEFELFLDSYEKILRLSKKNEGTKEFTVNNLKPLFMSKNRDNGTLLHDLMRNSFEEQISQFYLSVSLHLNKSEILSLLLSQDKSLNTPLMLAIQYQPMKVVNSFWEFIENHLNDFKSYLAIKNKNSMTVLQLSSLNGENFKFTSELFEKYFTPSEIIEIIFDFKQENFTFIAKVIEQGNIDACLAVSEFIEKLIFSENETFMKINLRQFLSHEKDNETIFNSPSLNRQENQNKMNAFRNLLRRTFEGDEEKFEEFLAKTSMPLKFKSFLNESSFEILSLNAWNTHDFEFFVQNFQQFEKRFKQLEINMSENLLNNQSFLRDLFVIASDDAFVKFISKIELLLKKKEMSKIFNTLDDKGQSLMMLASKFRNIQSLRLFMDAIRKSLNSTQTFKTLILTEDKKLWTVLQHSSLNNDSRSFEFIKNIFEENLTNKEIQNIVLKVLNQSFPFIYDVIQFSSLETGHKVATFLENLFTDEKLKLKNFILSENSQNVLIFTKNFKKSNPNLKVFYDLLRKAFNDDDQFDVFQKFIKIQKIYQRFFVNNFRKKISPENFNDLLENFNDFSKVLGNETFKLFLTSTTSQNLTVLHEVMKFEENEIYIEVFLENLENTLSKLEIYNLLLIRENFSGHTSLMNAATSASFENLKIFWNFIDKSLSLVEKEKLLLVEHGFYSTALQFSTWNKNPAVFLFLKQIYERFFTVEKIREIIFKVDAGDLSFIYGTIKLASSETALEVSKFLESLTRREKLKLREFLSHRDKDGNASFTKSAEEKNKIFVELLRKTFESNETEQFDEFLETLLRN